METKYPLMIELDRLFYRSFPADYHTTLGIILKNLYNNPDVLIRSLTGLNEPNQNEIRELIALLIRSLYFQSLETLFELIFTLISSKNNNVWINLSNSPWQSNYNKIKNADFSFLDKPLKISDNAQRKLEVSTGHWLFFFSMHLDDNVKESLEMIKKILAIFAKEFSDRDEYNSFKHSLRAFNATKNIKVKGTSLSGGIVEMSMKHAISYLKNDKKDMRKVIMRSKSLDTQKDIDSLLMAGRLISNIILTRRAVKLNEEQFIYYFNKNDLKECSSIRDTLSAFEIIFQK